MEVMGASRIPPIYIQPHRHLPGRCMWLTGKAEGPKQRSSTPPDTELRRRTSAPPENETVYRHMLPTRVYGCIVLQSKLDAC